MSLFASKCQDGCTLVHYSNEENRAIPKHVACSVHSVSCGSNEIFILTKQGQVWQFGDCVRTNYFVHLHTTLPKIVQMSLKNKHIFFVTETGDVYSRGKNAYAQLV